MAGIRMTGLASGMDTQALVSQLSEAYQKKVDNAKKAQTKAEWKKAVWADLNTKLQNFYKGALSTFKATGTYKAKSVSGDLSGIKITAGNKAVNGNHKVKVVKTASAQMWTGKQITKSANGSAVTVKSTTYEAIGSNTYTDEEGNTKSRTIGSLVDANGDSLSRKLDGVSFKVGDSAEVVVSAKADETIDDMVRKVNEQLSDQGTGLTAEFKNGAFVFTNTNEPGQTTEADGTVVTVPKDVTIKASDANSATVLGISVDGTKVPGKKDDTDTDNTLKTSTIAYEKVETQGTSIKSSTKVSDLLGDKWPGDSTSITIVDKDGNEKTVSIDKNMTLNGLANAMAEKGVNASYDENQGRFYVSSTNTGEDYKFSFGGNADVIDVIGLAEPEGKIDASSARIEYNGVEYKSNTNNFSINGLTFEVSEEGKEMQFSVNNDVDGIYNKVKDFLKEYNSLLKEMNTLYNASSSRGYDPLTSDEKDTMSEDEVKEWEKKIKDSLLRRDDKLSSFTSNFRTIMNKSVEVDGKRYSLSSFGINTGDWGERGLLHLDGDPDDSTTAGIDDKLKAAIVDNPEAVTKTFAALGNELYSYLMKAQAKTTTSSSQTFYDDLTLDADIKTQKENVKKMQEKMQDEEDKYYKQFAAMETAMSKLQSQQSYLSGLFGG
ncbi:MAG: flagellar filament capping protein FliD [Lachnospiraceae bacterium]|nr:flagellar filament capping protein FliD [Lachnospiraceae bacterium]